MKYRIQLDTTMCERQPERVQQYFASHIDWSSLQRWAETYLKNYPEAVVIVRETVEVERLRLQMVDGKVEATVCDLQDYKQDLTPVAPI